MILISEKEKRALFCSKGKEKDRTKEGNEGNKGKESARSLLSLAFRSFISLSFIVFAASAHLSFVLPSLLICSMVSIETKEKKKEGK